MNSAFTIIVFATPITYTGLLACFDAENAAMIPRADGRRSVWMAVLAMGSFWMFSPPLLSGGYLTTSLATTKPLIRAVLERVFFGKFVAAVAMSFACVSCCWPISTKVVNKLRYVFNVSRVYARSVSAKMVSFIVGIFDDVIEHFKGNAMSFSPITITREGTITTTGGFNPEPARASVERDTWINSDVLEKAGKKFSIYGNSIRIILNHLSLRYRFIWSGCSDFARVAVPFILPQGEAQCLR